jgi:hypothetical protein
MATFLTPPDGEKQEPVRLTHKQACLAREHYEKLTDEEFDEHYHDILAEASRRNAERTK